MMVARQPNRDCRPRPEGRSRRADDGIALVVVLWFLLILSIMAAGFIATTQTDTRIARNQVENARARVLADAGVHLALYNMLQPPPQGAPAVDGSIRSYEILGGRILVSVQSERGKIDLNTAQPELLKGLFESVGVPPEKSDALVAAIEDWRDEDDLPRLNGAESRDYVAAGLSAGAKNAPFDSVEELRQVLGMTPELYRRVFSALTVYSRSSRIDTSVAPPEALRAMTGLTEEEIQSLLSERAVPANEDEDEDEPTQTVARRLRGTFMIQALAQTPRGAVFVREAVAQLTGSAEEPILFYAWREGTRARFESLLTTPPPEKGLVR
jgi:general secretion pathway protein K